MDSIRTLEVSVNLVVELSAKCAVFSLELPGSTLLWGDSALAKATEIRKLVLELEEIGVPNKAVSLRSVRGSQDGGLLGRSTSAVYSLRIEVEDMSLVGAALGVISAQKNGSHRLSWRYPDEDADMVPHVARACAIAKHKAETLAQALDETLAGVHSFSELVQNTYPQAMVTSDYELSAVPRAAKARAVDLSFEMTHRKSVTVSIRVQYRLQEQSSTD